jgi:hypothetical protein
MTDNVAGRRWDDAARPLLRKIFARNNRPFTAAQLSIDFSSNLKPILASHESHRYIQDENCQKRS